MLQHTTQIPLSPTEEWRDIPGYEGLYVVSNLGQVKRIAQIITTKRGYTQRHNAKDKSFGLKNDYLYLWLYKHNQGRKFYVHELVALAFIGPRLKNHQVHHRNENRVDNRSDNLEYIDRAKHSIYHHQGEKNSASTITEADVRSIRKLYKTMPVCAIAKKLNISYHVVWQVSHNKSWRHIT